jgi:hypothetical protein
MSSLLGLLTIYPLADILSLEAETQKKGGTDHVRPVYDGKCQGRQNR